MSNFLKYIEEDIEVKKSMLSAMPVSTKTNKKHYIEKAKEIISTYSGYRDSVKKYVEVKASSISLIDSVDESKSRLEQLKTEIEELEEVKRITNPTNTYYEKLEFDKLFYDLDNYAEFDFNYMNEMIKKIYDKFTLINVRLTANNFMVTSYVHEYMSEFIKVVNEGKNDFSQLEPIFEKIYWVNPHIINHVELSFRQLIRKYRSKFEEYIEMQKNKAKSKYNLSSYEDLVKRHKKVHYEYMLANKESIKDLIEMAKKKEIDITSYLPESKLRVAAFNTLVVQRESAKNVDNEEKIYNDLKKLKHIVMEYQNYLEFLPFVEYSKNALNEFKIDKSVKEVGSEIEDLEEKLIKMNEQILGPIETDTKIKKAFNFFEKKEEVKPIKQIKIDSINLADNILKLYKLVDSIRFFNKVKSLLNDYVTLDDFLNLYHSYDFFKKKGLKNTYNPENYNGLLEISIKFDEFCSNPNNVVITSVPIFEKYDITKVIINKYRINNVNLTEDNLAPSNINTLLEYINVFLRIAHVLELKLTIPQLWFIVEADKISNKNSNN